MENDFRDILETKRLDLVSGLHLERTFLFDYLRTKQVFDPGDCEIICAEKTSEQKAGKFLDILSTKGQDGYAHFIDAIQISNPALFEVITGEKATAKPNPITSHLKQGTLDERYIPDLDIVTNHLQRAYTDLNDITFSYQQVTKDKQLLEKNLADAMSHIKTLKKQVESMEQEKHEATSDVMSSLSSANNEKETVVQQLQTLHSDLQERNTYIIALHMHLLAAQEKISHLKSRLHDAEDSKQRMQTELNLVTKNYDNQRHESIKLSEKLEFHKTDLQNYNEMKMNFRELQFTVQKVKIERDEAVNDLNSLKEWIEAFKARYDIVEKDKEQTRESHESIAAECYQLRQRVDELEFKLRSQSRELESTKKRCVEAADEIQQLKEHRDTLSASRKELMIERDRAQTDLDQAIQRYNDILKSRDETITRQANHCKHYEEKYEKKCAELLLLQNQLTSKEHDLEELRRAKFERELSTEPAPCTTQFPKIPSLPPDIDEAIKQFEEDVLTSVSDSSPDESHSSDDSFDWKLYRKTTNIIESLKKRLGKERKDGRSASPPSASQPSSRKDPDGILEELVPQKKALSPEAQKCLSMERNDIFKVIPAHATLACMFDSIAAPSNIQLKSTRMFTSPATDQRHDTVINRKALSDSGISSQDLATGKTLETKTKSETLYTSHEVAKRQTRTGLRRVLKKSLTEPIPGHESIFSFNETPEEDDTFDAQAVLNSPSFQKPFRQRAMAIKMKERPRSNSVPPETISSPFVEP